MSERTVTEQQVIAAFNKHCPNLIPQYRIIFNDLFPEMEAPEPPKVNEIIFVWDSVFAENGEWRPFLKFYNDDRIIVIDVDGEEEFWNNYRRQTPTERGES